MQRDRVRVNYTRVKFSTPQFIPCIPLSTDPLRLTECYVACVPFIFSVLETSADSLRHLMFKIPKLQMKQITLVSVLTDLVNRLITSCLGAI